MNDFRKCKDNIIICMPSTYQIHKKTVNIIIFVIFEYKIHTVDGTNPSRYPVKKTKNAEVSACQLVQ